MPHDKPDADWRDRQARTAALVGNSYVRIGTSERVIRSSAWLMQESGKLVSPSAFDPAARLAQRLEAVRAAQAHRQQVLIRALRETSVSLRRYAKEVVMTSQGNRWKARHIRQRSRAQCERALQLQCALRPRWSELP